MLGPNEGDVALGSQRSALHVQLCTKACDNGLGGLKLRHDLREKLFGRWSGRLPIADEADAHSGNPNSKQPQM